MTHEEIQAIAALDAVGAASEEEKDSLREHLAACGDCAREQRAYQDVASVIAYSLDPVDPPKGIRKSVLNTTGTHSIRRFVPVWTPTWWLATAAVFFLALFAWSELRVRAARETLAELQAHQRALEEENRRLAMMRNEIAAESASLASSETRMIALAGQQLAPAASARVFLDESRRRAIVFFNALPSNAADKSYQLWIIRADRAAPESAGVFDVDQNGSARIVIQNLPVETEIKSLAVTLEPRGGVPTPTGAMYLVGNV